MYDPRIHHRRSIRLNGYDYSQPGLYFITICVEKKTCLFGEISNGEMQLNDAGRMLEKWYLELENKFPDIRCGEHIVMPNHFHCIVENVGADLRVCPSHTHLGEHVGSPIQNSTSGEPTCSSEQNEIPGEHVGSPLRQIIQWFKTMTTNEYIRNVKTHNWPRFDSKLWQRNYWEHIIRNEKSHQRIAGYILNNPSNWESDEMHPNNFK